MSRAALAAAAGQSTGRAFIIGTGTPRSRESQVLLAEIGDERRRDPHATVRLEVVLDDRGEDPRHREPRAVQGVHELGPARFPRAEADLRAAGLERLEIRAA